MKLGSLLSLVLIFGFLFVAILRLHPVGQPLSHPGVMRDRSEAVTDIENVFTMDDYYIRNGQRETGSNNIVASVVFDYRGFDTLGEATVLFLVVSSISMLMYSILKQKRIKKDHFFKIYHFPTDISRIISFGPYLLYPIIIIFGAYLVVHGHLSPGGGFQGGAVMASGTALLLITSLFTIHIRQIRRAFSFFESMGLTIYIGLGFAGIGTSFLYNFLAHWNPLFLGRVIPFGPNPGYINSAGLLPFLSLAIGMEVFFGISVILVTMYHVALDKDIDQAREK